MSKNLIFSFIFYFASFEFVFLDKNIFFKFHLLSIKYIDKKEEEMSESIVAPSNVDLETKFIDAKAYLQTTSTKSGDNV